MPDGSGDNWNGSPREGGPVVSKWEHLPLSPDLLRSIAKFGLVCQISIAPDLSD
jgi:translation initiation factor 4A